MDEEFIILIVGYIILYLMSVVWCVGIQLSFEMSEFHPVLKIRPRWWVNFLLSSILIFPNLISTLMVYGGRGWRNPFGFEQPYRGKWEKFDSR